MGRLWSVGLELWSVVGYYGTYTGHLTDASISEACDNRPTIIGLSADGDIDIFLVNNMLKVRLAHHG